MAATPTPILKTFLRRPMAPADAARLQERLETGSVPKTELWYTQAKVAYDRSQHDIHAYLERTGAKPYDPWAAMAWEEGRAEALANQRERRLQWERKRRAEGDAEILAAAMRLADAYTKSKVSRIKGNDDADWERPAVLMTPERVEVLQVILQHASTKGEFSVTRAHFIGSRKHLGERAGVSDTTAYRFLKTLEASKAIVRTYTGGIRETEAGESEYRANRYFVDYNRLRELLGVPQKGKSRYDGYQGGNDWARKLWDPRKAFFNPEGFAHFSKSERQARRQRARQRALEAAAFNRLRPKDALTAIGSQISSLEPVTDFHLIQEAQDSICRATISDARITQLITETSLTGLTRAHKENAAPAAAAVNTCNPTDPVPQDPIRTASSWMSSLDAALLARFAKLDSGQQRFLTQLITLKLKDDLKPQATAAHMMEKYLRILGIK